MCERPFKHAMNCVSPISGKVTSVDDQFTERLVDRLKRRSLRLVDVDALLIGTTQQVLSESVFHNNLLEFLYTHKNCYFPRCERFCWSFFLYMYNA